MDQQTVTYLLIAALLATALLIALAVVIPRMPRRGGGSMAAATAGGPILLDSNMPTSRAAMSFGSVANGNGGPVNGHNGAVHDAEGPSSDTLTGLLSASRWGRIVADEDARVRRYRRPATIVMIELDGLERLTTRLGDTAGERLVPAVADTIRRLAREADFVARVSDGRFAVLLPETDEIQAINYVERVRRTCDLWLESGAVALKLAMGWASASGDDSLLDAGRIATERMYAEIHRNARRGSDLVDAQQSADGAANSKTNGGESGEA
jgi:diguanylate cyclase (GGDEF)-like protein